MAAVCAWHEHHGAAQAEIGRRQRETERMFVAGPALVEAYAVLTRLPPPHRLSAEDALRLVDVGFGEPGRILALDGRAYRALLRRAADGGISGGRVLKEEDFASFAARGLNLVIPGR